LWGRINNAAATDAGNRGHVDLIDLDRERISSLEALQEDTFYSTEARELRRRQVGGNTQRERAGG
jgi:hypothetical protein